MSRSSRNPAALFLLVSALALLVFAAPAAAETRVGEGTSPVDQAIPGRMDILSASAAYDSTSGMVNLTVTTREAPEPESGAQLAVFAGVVTEAGPCNTAEIDATEIPAPASLIVAPYTEPFGEAMWWETAQESPGSENTGPAAKSVVGATTTLISASPKAAGKPYNCAVVSTTDLNSGNESVDTLFFPIAVPTPSDPITPTTTPSTTTPQAQAQPQPQPAPGALSILGSKPVAAKAGRWTKVSVKVSNSGGTAVGPISIKAKAPAGVVVRPGALKVPALLPGQTWPLTLQVKLTASAKPKATIALTGTAGGLGATGSVVVRAAG